MPTRMLSVLLAAAAILIAGVQSADAAIALCPTSKYVNIWEPCAFDIGTGAAYALLQRVETEGYTVGVEYADTTEDTSYVPCTRPAWDDLGANCGILLIDSHGGAFGTSGYVGAAYASDKTVLIDSTNGGGWADKDGDKVVDPGMFVAASSSIPGQTFVGIEPCWFGQNWPNLGSSDVIAVVSACNSARGYQNSDSILDNLGTQVALGYAGACSTGDAAADMVEFFGLMDGWINAGNSRKAGAAYTTGGYSLGFKMIGDGDSTLCPAPADFYPGDGGTTNSLVGTAWINLDSFLSGTGVAGSALSVTVTPAGVCEITNVIFEPSQSSEDPLNRSRQVRFTYNYVGDPCHPAFTIRATAHASGIMAWGGGGQEMDGNKAVPNGDDVSWSFSYHP